ncbi:sigma-70 family RNA polymerase sigma factor [Bacillaceae bacterium Marseille-Q3522]|nr:sigma-70 family RNA polymerase sigma factor [Bacillaceae bacterium Marseille-Q3522]
MYTEDDVRKAIKGNKKSFAKIIHEEKKRLYRIAYLYVKNENDAVEIVQETTYKAFLSIEKVKSPEQISAWLKRITINSAIDFIRRQKKVTSIASEYIEEIPDKARGLDEKIDLFQLLDQLDERQKTVIILKYYEDLSNREIADIIGCPEGTVKSSLHRALKCLRSKMEEGYMNG